MSTIGYNNFTLYNSLVQLYQRRSELSQIETSLKANSDDDLRALNAEISHVQSRLDALKPAS